MPWNYEGFAKDKSTGKEQHKIESSSGLTDEEIQKMRDEAKANEDADKAAKEKVDKLNAADQMIFQTEKQMANLVISTADKKQPIEDAIAELKKAYEAQDIQAIDSAMETLNQIFKRLLKRCMLNLMLQMQSLKLRIQNLLQKMLLMEILKR